MALAVKLRELADRTDAAAARADELAGDVVLDGTGGAAARVELVQAARTLRRLAAQFSMLSHVLDGTAGDVEALLQDAVDSVRRG